MSCLPCDSLRSFQQPHGTWHPSRHLYRFALQRIDTRLVKLLLTAEYHREYAMDEPVRILDAQCKHDDRWIDNRLPAHNLDLSPQCADAAQLLDVSFGLQLELGEALQLRRLHVEYQPQFETSDGRGCGVEALARWVRRSGETIPPSIFVRLAERAGMIHTLGAWILQTACATASAWRGLSVPPSTLSVNVSALQIDEKFCSVIEQALNESGFPAKRLELEITESALIANPELTIEHLKEWKQLGVRIAMDDFGTGYSSLSHLSRLPVDRLKLDRSLVHRMTQDRKSAAVMRLIVSLGAELDMQVIAEGVETEEQLQMLIDFGCPQVQGYLLARPVASERVQAILGTAWGDRAMPPAGGIDYEARESWRFGYGDELPARFSHAARNPLPMRRLRRNALS
jgi:EAL domain-containing protein (putative c-di-GMP-specific phosphodiesterase class I)